MKSQRSRNDPNASYYSLERKSEIRYSKLGSPMSKSRFSQSPFKRSQNVTFEPSDFAISKIASNLGKLCKDLGVDETVDATP